MKAPWNVAAVFLLAAVALAGCSEDAGTGFTVKAPAEGAGPFVFTAQMKADNYTWDLGDRLTAKYGKQVEHTYDFANGQITVRLKATTGGKVTESSQVLVLGDGQNAAPVLVLEGQTNWAVVGETVKFSGAASTDSDGDALRFSWNCIRTGDAVRQGVGHSHGGGGGVPYGTPSAGSVESRTATGPLPAADRSVAGDLCDALGAGGRPSLDATIEGAFEKTGVYDVIMLASDPKTPTTSGRFTLYVTDPAERPSPVQVETFSGLFQGGAGGSFQSVCDTPGQSCDQARYSFSLPLAALVSFVNLTWGHVQGLEGTPADNSVTASLLRGENVVLAPSSEPQVVEGLTASTYTVLVTLVQGVQVNYEVQVTTYLNLDPTAVY